MLKKKIEERNAISAKIEAIDNKLKEDKREAFTGDESKDYAKLMSDESALNVEIGVLEAREQRAKTL